MATFSKEDNCFGKLSIVAMRGTEAFAEVVDNYLKTFREYEDAETYVISASCIRFGTGEGKSVISESVRGHDVYILCDVFNYGVTYKMYGTEQRMSPDDHYQDLKRIISAMGGKARRIIVIMPMLYEGRQHRRMGRESLDCAMMLQELTYLGVSDLITFDAHDPRIVNAVPICGFDNVQPTYQMIKALCKAYPDVELEKGKTIIISPDEGGMGRSMYYSSILKLDLGMFYKRRNYSVVINGKNPIEAHEYLGQSVEGHDVIIVDDMISSGESMIDVATKLKERGAKRIFVFCSFGLFVAGLEVFDNAYEKGVINKVFTTNLIYQPPGLKDREWYQEVNLAKYTALLIDTINHDRPISGILDPAQKISALIEKR